MGEYKIIGTIDTVKKEKDSNPIFTISSINKYTFDNYKDSKKTEYNIMIEVSEKYDIITSKLYKNINIEYDSNDFEKIILEAKRNSFKVEVIINENDKSDESKYELKSITIL